MSEERHVELARRLRDAHRLVASLEGTDDEKAQATRRLIALTDASKQDVARASARLDLLLADLAGDLDAGRASSPQGSDAPDLDR